MDWHFPRSVFSTGLMCQVGAERGLSAEDCLAGTRLRPENLLDPSVEVTPALELVVLGNIVRKLGHPPGIGFDLGAKIHIAVYGVLAFALASSQNIRELAELGTRYANLNFALMGRSYFEDEGNFIIDFDDSEVPEDLRQAVLERDLSGLYNTVRELFQLDFPMRELLLRHAEPPHAARYRERFGVVPQFSAPCYRGVSDRSVLDMSLPQANPQALRYWEAQLQELLSKKRARTGIAGKVRGILARQSGQVPDMEAIAAELCTTSRHLRRLLVGEGTSFRELVDELRETMAEELLAGARLTVEQVADRLGYNEVSSFSNAFKRWKGVAPRDWRNANLSTGASRASLVSL